MSGTAGSRSGDNREAQNAPSSSLHPLVSFRPSNLSGASTKEGSGGTGVGGVCILLRTGQTAIVDEADAKAVADYRWTWMPGRGVAAYFHGQTILMHNLIAPHARVSFKDGDKLNCRRENLTAHKAMGRKDIWTLNPRLGKGKHIWDDARAERYVFHRAVIEDGVTYRWNSGVSYRYAGKAKAMRMARKAAAAIKAMSREDFIAFVKFSRGKSTVKQAICEVVSEWSAFGGEAIKAGGYSYGELSQLGLSNRYINQHNSH